MRPRWFFLLVLLVFPAAQGRAQSNFVYTNNDETGPNTGVRVRCGRRPEADVAPGPARRYLPIRNFIGRVFSYQIGS